MMGLGTEDGGMVTVTDDDVIEKSNLSRQFLFRDWNIGQAKSTCAAVAALKLNPASKINALQNRVSPETETVFNDTFWEKLDLVVNALDNVNGRLYVDSRCVYFNKPLLESGTLGPKCNTQVSPARACLPSGVSHELVSRRGYRTGLSPVGGIARACLPLGVSHGPVSRRGYRTGLSPVVGIARAYLPLWGRGRRAAAMGAGRRGRWGREGGTEGAPGGAVAENTGSWKSSLDVVEPDRGG
eukprot:gene22622-29765_t